MVEVRLAGATPEPLLAYGKGLGVLRIVTEQRDESARCWWDGETFVLASALDEHGLVDFLAEEYVPTPIIAPWNSDSGFFGGRQNLGRIERLPDPRLDAYRQAIAAARDVLGELGFLVHGRAIPKPARQDLLKRSKARLIATLRGRLPDVATRWIDAAVVLSGEDPAYPPLFGTGGADGRFEFSSAFMGALELVLGDPHHRREALEASLFASPRPAVEQLTAGGLSPASARAPNAAEGFEGSESANLWDLILGIEGLLLLSASAARKFGSQTTALRATFPFIVRAVAAGHPTAGGEDARGEVWLPLWDRPASLREIRHVVREARAEWNGRPAATSVDIARALVSLGVDRGLTEFRRFGLQNRSGRSYLATPLGRFRVTWRPDSLLLAELDPFLDQLVAVRRARETPGEVLRLIRRFDDAVLAYCGEGDRARLLDVLIAVASLELALARRVGLRNRVRIAPLRPLSRRWAHATQDGSVEFRLAAAIASLQPTRTGRPGALRTHLIPVARAGYGWRWAEEGNHTAVWTGRSALADLGRIVARRLVEAEQEGSEVPFSGTWRARLSDVGALLSGEVDVDRLGRLVEALSLIDRTPSEDSHAVRPTSAVLTTGSPPRVPVAYALMKLTFLDEPDLFRNLGARASPRPDSRSVSLLKGGNVWEAARMAARRLRGVGLTPVAWALVARERGAIRPDPAFGQRLLAALAVPVGPASQLADLALETGESELPADLTAVSEAKEGTS